MILRLANNLDEENVYLLSNDTEVRKHSFNTNPFPYHEHKEWFQNQLKDKDTIFFVAYEEANFIGQIRLKITNKESIISISISSQFRSKGYGTKMMEDAIILIRKNFMVSSIKAYIKADNFVSKRFFENCGYIFIEQIIHQDVKTNIYAINIFSE